MDGSADTRPGAQAAEAESKLLADGFEALFDALEILYLRGNLSGRLKFVQDRPEAAFYILGSELIGYDRDGTPDRDRRAALEIEAEERRFALLERLTDIEKRCVVSGVLQFEIIEPLVRDLGRDLALKIFVPRLVNRVFPAPATEAVLPDAPALIPEPSQAGTAPAAEPELAPEPEPEKPQAAVELPDLSGFVRQKLRPEASPRSPGIVPDIFRPKPIGADSEKALSESPPVKKSPLNLRMSEQPQAEDGEEQ